MNDIASPPVTIDQPTKAADGGHVPGACNTLGDFVRSLEDGQFDADAYAAIKRLSAALTATAMSNGGKAKGKVTITLDFEQEGSVTQIKSAFKVTQPEARRPKSVMWKTDDNRLSRSRPGHGELFGIRDVSGPASSFTDA